MHRWEYRESYRGGVILHTRLNIFAMEMKIKKLHMTLSARELKLRLIIIMMILSGYF